MRVEKSLSAFFYSRDFTPTTQKWYMSRLSEFISWVTHHECEMHPTAAQDMDELDPYHVREFLDYVRKRPSPNPAMKGAKVSTNTVHSFARVCRAYLSWAAREELVDERILAKLKMPAKEVKVIRILSPTQFNQLVAACDALYQHEPHYRWLAERDKAILYTLLDTGLRLSELVGLKVSDVVFDRDDAHILVHGKGRKEREMGLGNRSRGQLYRYVSRFRPTTDSDYLFLNRHARHLEQRGVVSLLQRLKLATDIQGVRCSAHDFRHTFAYNYLKNGGDVFKLSLLLGHTSLTVTEGYLRAFRSADARKGVSVLDTL